MSESRTVERRLSFYEKPREQWSPHDWLWYAAQQLLRRGDEDPAFVQAANLVMDIGEEAPRD